MENRVELMLFVVNPQSHQALIDEFTMALDQHLPDAYMLNVIDVLSMPEKAIEHQVFATPMLIRHFPEPIMKLLLNISNLQDILVSIKDEDNNSLLV